MSEKQQLCWRCNVYNAAPNKDGQCLKCAGVFGDDLLARFHAEITALRESLDLLNKGAVVGQWVIQVSTLLQDANVPGENFRERVLYAVGQFVAELQAMKESTDDR